MGSRLAGAVGDKRRNSTQPDVLCRGSISSLSIEKSSYFGLEPIFDMNKVVTLSYIRNGLVVRISASHY